MTAFLLGFLAGFSAGVVGLFVYAIVTDRDSSPEDYLED